LIDRLIVANASPFMCDVSRDLLKVFETSDNISSSVQVRGIVAMKH